MNSRSASFIALVSALISAIAQIVEKASKQDRIRNGHKKWSQAGLFVLAGALWFSPAFAQSAIGGPHKQQNYVGGATPQKNPVVPAPRGATPLPPPTQSAPRLPQRAAPPPPPPLTQSAPRLPKKEVERPIGRK